MCISKDNSFELVSLLYFSGYRVKISSTKFEEMAMKKNRKVVWKIKTPIE